MIILVEKVLNPKLLEPYGTSKKLGKIRELQIRTQAATLKITPCASTWTKKRKRKS